MSRESRDSPSQKSKKRDCPFFWWVMGALVSDGFLQAGHLSVPASRTAFDLLVALPMENKDHRDPCPLLGQTPAPETARWRADRESGSLRTNGEKRGKDCGCGYCAVAHRPRIAWMGVFFRFTSHISRLTHFVTSVIPEESSRESRVFAGVVVIHGGRPWPKGRLIS